MQSSAINEQVFVDHYAILGLRPGVPAGQVQRNFRRLARIHHPDMRGGDALRFLEILNAYQLLMDTEARADYDRQYLRYQRSRQNKALQNNCKLIPLTRVTYSGNVVQFARRGLLRQKFRSRDRRRVFNIDYDLQVALTRAELQQPILVFLPLVVRFLCPDCRGSDLDCGACGGRRYHKTSRLVQVPFAGGLRVGQILDLDLSKLKPGPMSHFKRRRIRLRIARHPENSPAGL